MATKIPPKRSMDSDQALVQSDLAIVDTSSDSVDKNDEAREEDCSRSATSTRDSGLKGNIEKQDVIDDFRKENVELELQCRRLEELLESLTKERNDLSAKTEKTIKRMQGKVDCLRKDKKSLTQDCNELTRKIDDFRNKRLRTRFIQV